MNQFLCQAYYSECVLGEKLTWDRGEMVTIVSSEKNDKMLLRDSKGNEQLVSSTYARVLPSSVSHEIKRKSFIFICIK